MYAIRSYYAHREVGAVEEDFRGGAVVGVARHAGERLDLDVEIVELERAAQGRGDAPGEDLDVGLGGETRRGDDEAVGADAGGDVARTHRALEAVGEEAQHRVAGIEAEGLDDVAEAVEAEVEQRAAPARRDVAGDSYNFV